MPDAYTDAELAAIKRRRQLTVGDWDRMTPEQRRNDIAEFLARLDASDGNINRLDPGDPIHGRMSDDEFDEQIKQEEERWTAQPLTKR